ncbi:MAG TPA: hypothetical protein VIT23_17035, partial [Terrimicrobiaceae bacterium]
MNAAVIGRRDLLRLMGTSSVALATAGLTSGWAAGPQQAKSVATRKIPSSGEALPIVGLGTWQTFDVGPEPAALRPLEEVLQTFADMGGKVVDSSPMYGRSEEVV